MSLRVLIIVAVALGACFAVPNAARGAMPRDEVERIFSEANGAFKRATSLRREDSRAARALYLEAIDGYRRLIDEAGVENGLLRYNLANALLLTDQLGPAVVEYRRAEALAPGAPEIAANLREARQRVRTRFGEPGAGVAGAFAWHDDVPAAARVVAFAALFGGAWLVLLVRLLGPRPPRRIAAALFALALAPASSLSVTAYRQANVREGVVLDDVVGRKGPDERGYAPSFSEPLSEGVEFTVVERRPGWLYVRLPDGRATWIPEDSVTII